MTLGVIISEIKSLLSCSNLLCSLILRCIVKNTGKIAFKIIRGYFCFYINIFPLCVAERFQYVSLWKKNVRSYYYIRRYLIFCLYQPDQNYHESTINPEIFLNTHRNKFKIVRYYSAVMPETQGRGEFPPPSGQYWADQLTLLVFQRYLHVLSICVDRDQICSM